MLMRAQEELRDPYCGYGSSRKAVGKVIGFLCAISDILAYKPTRVSI